MSQTEKRLNLNGREIILVGTAHISKESIDQSVEVIRSEMPDCVAIELDEGRYESMKNPESWKNLDIVQVLKEGKGFVLMANLVLSSFQKRMGADVGVKPGDEMRAAIAVAEELNIPCEMVDRPIQTTLRRAWGKNNLWGKCKLLASLISSAFSKEEFSEEDYLSRLGWIGEQVALEFSNERVHATLLSVNGRGELVVKIGEEIKEIAAGEISLRVNER